MRKKPGPRAGSCFVLTRWWNPANQPTTLYHHHISTNLPPLLLSLLDNHTLHDVRSTNPTGCLCYGPATRHVGCGPGTFAIQPYISHAWYKPVGATLIHHLFFFCSANLQAAAGGGAPPSSTTTHKLQHIDGYTPPPSSELPKPTPKSGSILAGTQDIPRWSSQNLVQATQGGVYFGGGNKDPSKGQAGAGAPMASVPKAVTLAVVASAAGVLFTMV